MTALETVQTVFMLIDETRRGYFPFEVVIETINKAQRRRLEEYHAVSDERAMRPLTVVSDLLDDTEEIPDFLYLRGARHYLNATLDETRGLYAHFIDYDKYFSHEGNATTLPMPLYLNYTVANSCVYFGKRIGTERLRITYVRKPVPFELETDGITVISSQDLELPPEYHFDIARLAAVFLNDLDVEEQGREITEQLQ